jgi:23S rRNA (guanosine2251-2'-O)-methyltransferase
VVEYLYRRNTVTEALRGSRRQLFKLWAQGDKKLTQSIRTLAKERGIPIEEADKAQLSQLAGDKSHQGIVLEVGPYQYCTIEDTLSYAESKDERPFLLLLDLVHGPQNIGSLLRTAEACGIHGVVLQDRRAPDITPHIVNYSAGSAEHLLIAKVTNLVRTMERLKESNIWILGLDTTDQAQLLGEADLNMPLGLVVGHEGEGLRRLVRDRCDFLLRLPMRGAVESLNAASAGAVVLYAAWQARDFEGSGNK